MNKQTETLTEFFLRIGREEAAAREINSRPERLEDVDTQALFLVDMAMAMRAETCWRCDVCQAGARAWFRMEAQLPYLHQQAVRDTLQQIAVDVPCLLPIQPR